MDQEFIDFTNGTIRSPGPVPVENTIPQPNFFGKGFFSSTDTATGSGGGFNFGGGESVFGHIANFFQGLANFLEGFFGSVFYDFFHWFLVFLAILAALAIFYYYFKIEDLEREERKKIRDEVEAVRASGVETKDTAFDQVLAHVESSSESEWKLAILEADVMLSAMLDWMGYAGETVSDKLKIAQDGGMKFIDEAWEAHKVRNRIAHEQDFHITQREAKRIIYLYEKVFRAANYI